jgi:hypothetical protein
VSEAVKIIADHGPKPEPESKASQNLIDACFAKMNSVYGQYKFTNEDWCEMMLLAPDTTRQICSIETMSAEELTYGDLRKYYDLHLKLWKSYNARANSLNDRLKKITQT